MSQDDKKGEGLALPLETVQLAAPDGFLLGWCVVDANKRVLGYCMTERQAHQLADAANCATPATNLQGVAGDAEDRSAEGAALLTRLAAASSVRPQEGERDLLADSIQEHGIVYAFKGMSMAERRPFEQRIIDALRAANSASRSTIVEECAKIADIAAIGASCRPDREITEGLCRMIAREIRAIAEGRGA